MKEISLYVHIPFCKQKCLYCDFPSYSGKEKLMNKYIDALITEIKQKCRKVKIKSLFIGGGTPSYLENDNLEKLLKELNKLDYIQNAEKTIECNPKTVDIEKLKIIKEYGINRISFGLQSADDKLLKSIGRIHNYNEFVKNYYEARDIGFNNINIDVMFGLPNQKVSDYIDTLNKIIVLKPEHISAYSLILEEGTPLYEFDLKKQLNLPSEDEERNMYHKGKEILEKAGFHQYEISNYAKEGRECRHNIVYWRCEEYFGVGASASSYYDNKRIKNLDNIEEYINNINLGKSVSEIENINTVKDNIEEFMFMGLRMISGSSEKEFFDRFKKDIDSIYKTVIDKNIENGLLVREAGRVYLTSKGIELSNYVMSDMIL